jgi:hypothetical protein
VKNIGDIYCIGARCQITWQPSLSTVQCTFFHLQYDFVAWLKPIGGLQRNEEIFARPSNMYCLFTEYRWSEVEKLLKYVVLGCVNKFSKKPPSCIVYIICFHLICGENGKCNSSLENQYLIREPSSKFKNQ